METKMRRQREWFDQDAFWRELYLFMFSPARFAEGSDQVERLIRLVNQRKGAVLDLCCGPGRMAIPLSAHGFNVTGVDRTPYLLQRARANARAACVDVEWVRADMRDFVRPAAFDLALSLFTSFGYFDRKEEDLLVLQNIHRSLRPGGFLVMDVLGKEILARIAQPTTSELLPDGALLVMRHEVFDDWTRIRNDWLLVRKGRTRTFKFHHTVYSGQELRNLLERAGFGHVTLYGNLDGAPYDVKAQRLIAVARRS